MRVRKFRYFVGDFETTVYKGQDDTAVWASAVVEFHSEDVKIFHTIGETLEYFISLNENICCYYHNLKFDGSFWLSHLLVDLGWKQSYTKLKEDSIDVVFDRERDMKNNTFKYSISDMGQWYSIILKVNNRIIELRDSLKLLPFSVKKIGNSFGTKHKKLEMEYEGLRYPGCEITEEERKYIANDVLVVKEALEIMFKEGHNKLTIGSCCLAEYEKLVGKQEYKAIFPNVYDIPIDEEEHKYDTAGEWIRKSYKGGWCYLVKGKENKIKHNGTTADVNSLYPSMMSSESGNYYPIGEPTFWTGNYIPEFNHRVYYFVRIKTRFYLKSGYLPFIQIKGNPLYRGTECLTTSDVYNSKTGKYTDFYYDADNVICPARVELTLTMTDFELLKEHYYLEDFEILDGCYFESAIGIFDKYIEKYKKIKMTSKGALRELAKLFLNNLYGKMASSKDSSFKVAYVKDDKSVGFYQVKAFDKEPGYIPVGSAITSYARNFTIRAAQKNFYGVDKPGFIYADTDSIHCDLAPEEIKGIKVDDRNFCCWKLESCWDDAIFVRQKTYIEHVTHENLEPIEEPYYNVKCAGMPDSCKNLFLLSMKGENNWTEKEKENIQKMSEEKQKFVKTNRTLRDFKISLSVPGKLRPMRIRGGVLLVETSYEMR